MFLSPSRELIFKTAALRSSIAARARGSTILITQLQAVWKFLANLDTSAAEISVAKISWGSFDIISKNP